ncbi:cytochrome-b5 reductase [Artomyces pyxidatus]|uniref:Cytochrome-b5 reductase n=1 Tax=Artomyces pyxidatus TaxID=48021 RepID=A0ACB8TE48_9AGAM|nr:cytochrome-b5 reductase [Artomyces pyxidatus]
MSFLCASAIARPAVRRFSTEARTAKARNAGLWAVGAGSVGLAAYLYLDGARAPATKAPGESPLDPASFVDVKLKKVVPYNHNTAKFVFEVPGDGLPVASCVVVRASDPEALKDAEGKPAVRPYTPISRPDAPGELVLLVKRYERGVVSKYVHDALEPGDTLAIKGPIMKFPYKLNEFDEVALIGGGSGITPLYQLLVHALPDPANKTRFKLIFSNVTEADILLREELDALKQKYPETFDVVYTLGKPPAGWAGAATSSSDAGFLKVHVAPPSLGDKVKVFVCGPPGQVNAIAGKKAGGQQGELGGVLKELGYTEDQVFKF